MSPRDWQKRFLDIRACAKNIRDFTAGMNFDSFVEDAKTVRAVAFELITMGEATRALPQEVQEQYPDIPWGKMQGIRNVLVHEYFHLDEEILWQTSQVDIPILMDRLEQIVRLFDKTG